MRSFFGSAPNAAARGRALCIGGVKRSRTGRCALVIASLLGASGSAWGQAAELWFNAGESLLSSGLGGLTPNDYYLTNGFRFGFAFTFNPKMFFGAEVAYNYNRTHLHSTSLGADLGGMAIHQGDFNALAYATKEGSRIRPFATGGIGFANYVPPGTSATSGGGSTEFSVNYGGGIKVKLTSLISARLDYKQYATPKPFGLPNASGWVHQNVITGGVGIGF
ncbi:MAG: outer membrane beta-barrel protein [Bryobacterales bacterium]|nr:outer membrane beta-barrel protein [Bryobacterales bacterium]MBV9397798.1 outer membrane beta-barrel protein [Bryobacterales bacterium]